MWIELSPCAVLIAAFLLVVSLFHYLASRIGNPKLEYMKVCSFHFSLASPKFNNYFDYDPCGCGFGSDQLGCL